MGTLALVNIITKEFIQIRRDIRSVMIIIFIPIFLLVVFGYGVTMDIKNITVAVCDFDRTSLSRRFVERFIASGFFNLKLETERISEIDNLLISGKIKLAIVIPRGFSKKLEFGKPADVQFIIDGSDANIANVVLSYVQRITGDFSADLVLDFIFMRTSHVVNNIEFKPRIWFNQELKSVNFFIPGLMGLIMMMLTVLMTSLSISRERELGSFEKLISAPLNPFYIVFGKVVPYAFLGFVDSILILLAGYILFELEVKGNIFELLFVTIIFILCGLNIGLIISTVARSQQATIAIAFISTLVPTFVLSGFVFPIRNMPGILQFIASFVPARYYLQIIRGIILKGNHLEIHLADLGILCSFLVFTFAVASARLKKLMKHL